MLNKTIIGFFAISLILSSCDNEYKFILNSPKKLQINQTLTRQTKTQMQTNWHNTNKTQSQGNK